MKQKKQILRLLKPLERSSYSNLSTHMGVYAFKLNDEYLYIGKSIQIKPRVLSHVENAKYQKKEFMLVSQANGLETYETDSEFHALLLESNLIQLHQPKYNVIWKDDKSHLYIKISKEKLSKISVVRKEIHKNAMYFGPFGSQRETTALLRLIRRIIPFCMAKHNKKPCFYNKIGLCDPCPGEIVNLYDEIGRAHV